MLNHGINRLSPTSAKLVPLAVDSGGNLQTAPSTQLQSIANSVTALDNLPVISDNTRPRYSQPLQMIFTIDPGNTYKVDSNITVIENIYIRYIENVTVRVPIFLGDGEISTCLIWDPIQTGPEGYEEKYRPFVLRGQRAWELEGSAQFPIYLPDKNSTRLYLHPSYSNFVEFKMIYRTSI